MADNKLSNHETSAIFLRKRLGSIVEKIIKSAEKGRPFSAGRYPAITTLAGHIRTVVEFDGVPYFPEDSTRATHFYATPKTGFELNGSGLTVSGECLERFGPCYESILRQHEKKRKVKNKHLNILPSN